LIKHPLSYQFALPFQGDHFLYDLAVHPTILYLVPHCL